MICELPAPLSANCRHSCQFAALSGHYRTRPAEYLLSRSNCTHGTSNLDPEHNVIVVVITLIVAVSAFNCANRRLSAQAKRFTALPSSIACADLIEVAILKGSLHTAISYADKKIPKLIGCPALHAFRSTRTTHKDDAVR